MNIAHFSATLRNGLGGTEGMVWKILRKLYNGIDRTYVPAPSLLRALGDNGLERLELLSNGVDSELFNPIHRSESWRASISPCDRPIVLYTGRLVWEKDLRVLAQAYRQLRSEEREFDMVVVGDGPARTELAAMMPGARFLGFRSGIELATCYASSDIFAFPSTTETFGLVTVEAMACGLVPVVARTGGSADVVENLVSGMTVMPQCRFSLAREIGWLIDHPAERQIMARNALRQSRRYHWNKIIQRQVASYEQVIGEHVDRVESPEVEESRSR